MRIAIIGGGPAGLYFAILTKRSFPGHAITIYERNRPDDTFGFGVVFSDETLDNIERADPTTFAALKSEFSYWDDIEINFKGTTRRIGGNGFCGCARSRLLAVLQRQARSLGVDLRFQHEIEDVSEISADLVVAADGLNSRVRDGYKDVFRPQIDQRPNRFSWMGSTRTLDAFTFHFRETEHGIFIAHCYQYEPDRSTWVLETDPETFARSGLNDLDEEEGARFMQRVFAKELAGHPLFINRSIWRTFPMIRCERWVKDNIVLIGDAKATAHFSIGSGTKLAIEDAIELHRAFVRHPRSVEDALAGFEVGRREEVERTQHAADVSLVWFEHVRRFWDMHPTQFAFGLMTRSKAITYDNLALRAPDFVADVDELIASQTYGIVGEAVEESHPPAFQPFRLREMQIANRIVVSPMCQYSAVNGLPNDWHLVHYGSRAIGGAGLMFTEMTNVAAEARISPGCTGIYNDEQERAWARIVDFVHHNSATKFCLQLGHAGRKGATKLMWEGIDEPLEEGAWEIMAASPLAYFPHSQVPREMSRSDMDKVRDDYIAAARRGERAGFDMLELHCAHGYLLASFISPLTNHRKDEYGGSLDNRLHYPLEIFRAIRDVWPIHKPMSVRISATDWAEGGITGEESVEISRAFAEAGCDLIDVSTGQTVADAEPIFGRMFQTPFSDAIRNEAGLATMCVGNITTPDQANTIIAAGRADLVAFARPHLVDPSLTMRAAAWYGVADMPCPPQYLAGKDQLMRNSVRDRNDMNELKRRARPAWRAQPPVARAAE
ncbi:MAG: anthraniloyl-CoA monooxygenase [Methylobacteriaceae bacterium]|jgi:anthraniloyl-CoA monooxygenase|nr:anthraniloyl-CoA monooxygenase [Methylobacteriaceae bacterium]